MNSVEIFDGLLTTPQYDKSHSHYCMQDMQYVLYIMDGRRAIGVRFWAMGAVMYKLWV